MRINKKIINLGDFKAKGLNTLDAIKALHKQVEEEGRCCDCACAIGSKHHPFCEALMNGYPVIYGGPDEC